MNRLINYFFLVCALKIAPHNASAAFKPCDTLFSQFIVSVRVANINVLHPNPKAGLYIDGSARDCVDRIFNFTLYLEESNSSNFEIQRIGMKIWQSKNQELIEINDKALLESAAHEAIASFTSRDPVLRIQKFKSVVVDGTLYMFDPSEFSYLSKNHDQILMQVREKKIDLGYVFGEFWKHTLDRWQKSPWIFLPGTLYDGGAKFHQVGGDVNNDRPIPNPTEYKLSLSIFNLLDSSLNGKVLISHLNKDEIEEKKYKTLLPGFLYSWVGAGWSLIKAWTPFSYELEIYFDLGVVIQGDGTKEICNGHLGRESFESLFELTIVQLIGADLKSKHGKSYITKLKSALSSSSKGLTHFNEEDMKILFTNVAKDLTVEVDANLALGLFKEYLHPILQDL